LIALFLISCGGSVPVASSAPSPEKAIAAFDPSNAAIEASFSKLNVAARDKPVALRQAALAHLKDSNPDVHYAAVYALALTVTGSQGSKEMAALLTAVSLDDRLLAAGALTGIGDKRGLPVLIAALDQDGQLLYRDPPQAAFQFARTELLYFTKNDFGTASSTDFASTAATKPSWESWWQVNKAALRFDSTSGKYSP
jgi:hypothetical protein